MKYLEKGLIKSYEFSKIKFVVSFVLLAIDIVASINLDVFSDFMIIIILVIIVSATLSLFYLFFLLLAIIPLSVDYFSGRKTIIIPKETSVFKNTFMSLSSVLLELFGIYVVFMSLLSCAAEGIFSLFRV